MKNFIVLILLLLNFQPSFALGSEERIITDLYKKINPAIVCVDSQVANGMSCEQDALLTKEGLYLRALMWLIQAKILL